MQGLGALAPVSAAHAPGKQTARTPQSGSEFASELEALEAQPELARPTVEAAELAVDAPDEAVPEEVSAEAEDLTGAMTATPEEGEAEEPKKAESDARPAPRAELVQDSAPPERRAEGVSQEQVRPDKSAETAPATRDARKQAPEMVAGESRPAARQDMPLDAPEDARAPRSSDAPTTREPSPARTDLHRPSSVSEIALNAGLRASTPAGLEQPKMPEAAAAREVTVKQPPREAVPDVSAKAPANTQSQSLSPTIWTTEQVFKRAALPERAIRDLAETRVGDALKTSVQPSRDDTQAAAPTLAAAMVQPDFAVVSDVTTAEIGPEPEMTADVEALGLGLASGGEGSGRLATSPLPPGLQAHGPAVAQQIATQIGAQIAQQSGGATEIMLDPQELGRVTFSLSSQDGGITVAIAAERPETAELIRRHLEGLTEELRQIGYADVNVGFSDLAGQGGDPDEATCDGAPDGDGPEQIATEIPVAGQRGKTPLAGAGLDIRL